MTDNEIIKELQEEIHLVEYVNGDYSEHASLELLKCALDLINRQKAEIECLNAELEAVKSGAELLKADNVRLERMRAEAIREFAKRLKKKTYPFPCAIGVENAVTIRAINDLVEEMTEGENG